MNMPEPVPDNNRPEVVHHAEQMWGRADEQLQKILDHTEGMLPVIYENAGGNTDISALYDYWKAYIQVAENTGATISAALGMDENPAHTMTILVCAAALTRLMRADDRMRADTVLAQLEKEIKE